MYSFYWFSIPAFILSVNSSLPWPPMATLTCVNCTNYSPLLGPFFLLSFLLPSSHSAEHIFWSISERTELSIVSERKRKKKKIYKRGQKAPSHVFSCRIQNKWIILSISLSSRNNTCQDLEAITPLIAATKPYPPWYSKDICIKLSLFLDTFTMPLVQLRRTKEPIKSSKDTGLYLRIAIILLQSISEGQIGHIILTNNIRQSFL